MPFAFLPAINDVHSAGIHNMGCVRKQSFTFAQERKTNTDHITDITEQFKVAADVPPAASEERDVEDIVEEDDSDRCSDTSDSPVGHGGFVFENLEAIAEEEMELRKKPSGKRRMSKHEELLDTRQAALDLVQESNNALEEELNKLAEQKDEDQLEDEFFTYMMRNIRSRSLTAYTENNPNRRAPNEESTNRLIQMDPPPKPNEVSPVPFRMVHPPPEPYVAGVHWRPRRHYRRGEVPQKVNYHRLLEKQATMHEEMEQSHAQYCKVLRSLEDTRGGGFRRLSQMFGIQD